jgi:hypothetical protein
MGFYAPDPPDFTAIFCLAIVGIVAIAMAGLAAFAGLIWLVTHLHFA